MHRTLSPPEVPGETTPPGSHSRGEILHAVQDGLERDGYAVLLAGDDSAADEYGDPEMVLLDLSEAGVQPIPPRHGGEGCERIPVILISAAGRTQPPGGSAAGSPALANLGELVSRVARLVRRAHEEDAYPGALVTCGDLVIDFARRNVTRGAAEVHLTPTEYELLREFVRNPDRVLTHRYLLTRLWGPEYAEETHTLRVHLANLRNKIEPDPGNPRFICTEPRVGYRFRTSG